MLRLISITILSVFSLFLIGCSSSEPKSTRTRSDHFENTQQKKEFLEQYVTFRRTYESLNFDIHFQDNSSGLVSGPSDWDIRIVAQVPPESLKDWHANLQPTTNIDTSWISSIPNSPTQIDSFSWFADDTRVVGIDSSNNRIAYRNLSR